MIPPDAELTARHDEIPAWDDMPDDLKPVLARQMEVYAGFLEHTDHHVGRLIDALADLERPRRHARLLHHRRQRGVGRGHDQRHLQRDDEPQRRGRARDRRVHGRRKVDQFGTPEAYNHYAVGWAHAMDTPYQWTKQVASHWGGTRNGTIVHWPSGHRRPGRDPHPVPPRHRRRADGARGRRAARADLRQRRPAAPDRGREHGYAFDDADAAERHDDAVLRDVRATAASTTRAGRRSPATARRGSSATTLPPFDDDVWELYDAATTGPRRTTSRPSMPDKLAELQRLFLIEARKYNVLPLDDRRVERFNADLAGRPQLIHGNSQLLFGGMGRLTENSVINIKNKSHAVTAEVVVPEGGATGVIVAQGGAFGGWSLYLHEGRPTYCYNLFGIQRFKVDGADAVPAGDHQVRVEFAYDGGGLGKGGTADLYVDGDQGRRGPGRRHRADDLLRRRDDATSAATPASPRQRRLRRRDERLHRHGPLGPDRPRRGRRGRRPPDHARGAAARRDGPPVGARAGRFARNGDTGHTCQRRLVWATCHAAHARRSPSRRSA